MGRRRRPVMAAAVLVSIMTVTACGSHDATSGTGSTHQAGGAVRVGGSLPASATLVLADGATRLVVRAGNISDVVSVAGSASTATVSNGPDNVVTVHASGAPVVTVDDRTRWTIEEDGGASSLAVNMATGHLATLTLSAGVSSAAVDLPAPTGLQQLVEDGGASSLMVTTTAPTRVVATGGASSVVLHGVSHSGVAGGATFTDPGWTSAADRLLVSLHGGVSSVSIVR